MIRRAFRRGLTLGLLGGAVAAGAKALQGRRAPAPAASGPAAWPPMADATPVVVPEPAADVQVAPGPDPQPLREEPPAPVPAPEPTVPDSIPEPIVEVHTGTEAEEHFADASRQVERPLSDWEPTAPLPPAEETTPLTPPAVADKPAPAKKAPAARKKAAAPAKKAAKKAAKPAAPSVEPTDGECPETHPVKGKLASKIFHVPGGFNYPRTRPDRCYVDAAAAEADGLRPSKR